MLKRVTVVLSVVAVVICACSAAFAGKIHEAAAHGDVAAVARLLKANPKLINAPDKTQECIATGWTPLHAAATSGQVAVVKYLLSKGANINVRGAFDDTPLHAAARCGHPEVVKVLLAHKAKASPRDYRQDTPLHLAAGWKTAALLVAGGAEINAQNRFGETPLTSALTDNRTDVVKLLLGKNARVTIREAAMMGDPAGLKAILAKNPALVNSSKGTGQTPLHMALLYKHKEAALALIQAGADVRASNAEGITPLIYAAADGYLDVAQILIDKGANVNALTKQGDYWASPLHAAAGTSNIKMASLLLSKGADINLREYGYADQPIHTAVTCGDAEMVSFLLAKGVDVNSRMYATTGSTPLYLAVQCNRPRVVEVLLAAHADVNAMDTDGMAPLHLATKSPRDIFVRLAEVFGNSKEVSRWRYETGDPAEVVEMLIGSGADVNAVDAYGHTPLALAETRKAVEALLAHGATHNTIFEAALAGDVDALKAYGKGDEQVLDFAKDSEGRVALHHAAIAGNLDVAKLLIGESSYVSMTDDYEMTPLHYAAREGNTEMVKLLLAKGADANDKDRYGQTPLQLASQAGNKEIEQLLRSHKAGK